MAQASAQFFVQQVKQTNIKGAETAYVVLTTGDTIRGTISQVSYQDSLITQVNFRNEGERLRFPIENITTLAVLNSSWIRKEEAALGPVLKSMKNKDFIDALPDDGYIIFEKIRLPGNQERYQLAQLLNPGWDTKIKVFKHPEAEITGYTKIALDITIGGLMENKYYFSVGGDKVFELSDFQYRKRGLERIFSSCPELRDKKLKWKELPEDVFTHFQKCL